jgi:hypothetical protein
MHRWPDGLDREVMRIRSENKNLIIEKLINKIEHRSEGSSRFTFWMG